MSEKVISARLDGLEAWFRIGLAEVEAFRHALATPPTRTDVPSARLATPPRCEGIKECALNNEDARIDKSTFAGSGWKCRGCGHQETSTAAT